METAIIILNYRTAALTIQCLRSLAGQLDPSCNRVVVVEGCSGDDSARQIQSAIADEKWDAWASLTELTTNRGYAAGNNAAIRAALAWPDPPRYILILNPDTIVRERAVCALVEFMDAHSRVGIAGSRLEDPDGTPQCAAFRFPSIPGELEAGIRMGWFSNALRKWRISLPIGDTPHVAGWVAGASFMVRSSLFKDVGLMDERYFLYFEEMDFCLQATRAGWECWHVPQSRVVHLIGQSTGVSRVDQRPPRRPSYWFKSRRHYFRKNYGRFYGLLADLAWMSGFSAWRLRRALQRRPDNDPPHLLWDFFRSALCFS